MEWNLSTYSNKILSILELFNFLYVVSNHGSLIDIKHIKNSSSSLSQIEKYLINKLNIKEEKFVNVLLSKNKLQ